MIEIAETDMRTLKNNTAQRLSLLDTTKSRVALQIAPFGEEILSTDDLDMLNLQPWIARGIVTVEVTPPVDYAMAKNAFYFPIGIAVWGLIIFGIWHLFGTVPANYWSWVLGIIGVSALGVIIYSMFKLGGRELFLSIWLAIRQGSGYFLSLSTTLVVAVAVPFLVTLSSFANMDDSLTNITFPGLDDASSVAVVGKFLQFLLISCFCAAPPLFYFLYSSQKVNSLRERFFRSVLTVDPNVNTLGEARSVYENKVNEYFGLPAGESLGRIARTGSSVILITTFLVTIGWLLTLEPYQPFSNDTTVIQLFQPQQDPLIFAFLGAYVFTVGWLFRRYVRSDLKPEAYAAFIVRLSFAVALTWTISLAGLGGQSKIMLALAFVIGVFPDAGITLLSEKLRELNWLKISIPITEDTIALENLEGINLYHRERLLEEGIENIENLAHADLIELMLGTRLPLPTIIDWVDQSILYIHTIGSKGGALAALKDMGIRTATDLEVTYAKAKRRGTKKEFESFLGVKNSVMCIVTLLDALGDDEWMENLRRYRRHSITTLTEQKLLKWGT